MIGVLELYCETNPGEFSRLDIFDDENVTLNYLYKDSLDISKIYSTYSLNFSVPASDKNKSIFNFIFKPEVQSSKGRFINGKIYINKQLFKVGQFEIQTGKFINNKLNTYNLNFSTGVGSLKTIIGEDLLSSLSGSTSTNVNWSVGSIYSGLTSTINPNVLVPLISNKRVWTYGDNGLNDIKYYGTAVSGKKGVDINELRPAVRLSTIMDEIFTKYNLSVTSPLFATDDYKKLFVWCNNETLRSVTTANGFRDLILERNFGNYVTSFGTPPATKGYNIFYTAGTSVFTITRDENNVPAKTERAFMQVFIPIVPILPKGQEITCEMRFVDQRPATFGQVFYTTTVNTLIPDTNTYNTIVQWSINDALRAATTLANPLKFKIEFKFSDLVQWSTCVVNAKFYKQPTYGYEKKSDTNSSNIITPAMTAISAIGSIPDMKIIDLLSSVFNMFSIRVVEDNVVSTTGTTKYPPMLWIPSSEFITNVEKDYTPNIDISNYDVEVPQKYKSYIFTHKQPNYKKNLEWTIANADNPRSKEYGQLIHTVLDSTGKVNNNLTAEYRLETQVSITPPVVISGTQIQTFHGFTDATKEPSEEYPDGAYTPNFEDITLFYFDELKLPKSGDGTNIDICFISGTTNVRIPQYVNFSIGTTTDENNYTNSLGFKDEVNLVPTEFIYLKNLYSKYYDSLIRTITNESLYYFNFVGWLTAAQILDFNMRDIIIIGNQRYVIEAATINLITGYSTFKLLNVPTVIQTVQQNYVYNPTHYDKNHYKTIQ